MSISTRRAHPPNDSPDYQSSRLRAPKQPLRVLPGRLGELTAPLLAGETVGALDNDLTRQHDAEPLGERITISGRVLDEDGDPVSGALIEVWQANAAGRYIHEADQHRAPLDPNFRGDGRMLTDDEGAFRFLTIKPGAYPWRNSPNAWRPAHIHFSLFGSRNDSRLVTQMYFPGDPLLAYDPVVHSIADAAARERLVSRFDPDLTEEEWALGFRFDIVLRGHSATPMES